MAVFSKVCLDKGLWSYKSWGRSFCKSEIRLFLLSCTYFKIILSKSYILYILFNIVKFQYLESLYESYFII